MIVLTIHFCHFFLIDRWSAFRNFFYLTQVLLYTLEGPFSKCILKVKKYLVKMWGIKKLTSSKLMYTFSHWLYFTTLSHLPILTMYIEDMMHEIIKRVQTFFTVSAVFKAIFFVFYSQNTKMFGHWITVKKVLNKVLLYTTKMQAYKKFKAPKASKITWHIWTLTYHHSVYIGTVNS